MDVLAAMSGLGRRRQHP